VGCALSFQATNARLADPTAQQNPAKHTPGTAKQFGEKFGTQSGIVTFDFTDFWIRVMEGHCIFSPLSESLAKSRQWWRFRHAPHSGE
jgi:hypothetical protein